MQSRSEIHTQPNGARVEVGTVELNGRAFAAFGSVVDTNRGTIHAYVTECAPGEYLLTTWNGETIAPLTRVQTWTQRGFHGVRTIMYAWRAVIDGRTYCGRNAGPCMFVRMRAAS